MEIQRLRLVTKINLSKFRYPSVINLKQFLILCLEIYSMKNLIILLFGLFLIISCNNNDDFDCFSHELEAIDLFSLYPCDENDTPLYINSNNNRYYILSNQTEFNEIISTNCDLDINFILHDLIVGKTNFQPITYNFLQDECEENKFTLIINTEVSDGNSNHTFQVLTEKGILDINSEIEIIYTTQQ